MINWSGEFHPRSLCSWGGGGESDGGGPSGDSYSGDQGGDQGGYYSGDAGSYGIGDEGGDQGGFTAPGGDTGGGFTAPGGDSYTAPGGDQGNYYSGDASTYGTGYEGGPTGGDSYTGFSPADSYGPGGDTSSYYGGDQGTYYSGPADTYGTGGGGEFGGWGPTAGVDYTGAGPGWGVGPADTGWGQGGAMGPPGWSTSDFGTYGVGGPTSTGLGPGAPGATIGGPGVYAQAPGITGFQGDFGAPPGGALGMPASQGDVGPQVGPGMPGGPGYVGNAEPSLTPGILQGDPYSGPAVNPDDRSEIAPSNLNFGPEFATNQQAASAGWFGPSQAQAASRGTDEAIINAANFENAFGRTGADMAQYMAQTNPGLADALNTLAANIASTQGQVGPGMPGLYDGATPGAQQGFTGVSPAQAAAGGPFTGQPSGDRGDTAPAYQPGNTGILAGVEAAQQANQQQAMQQAAMFDAQARGEQGRGPSPTDQMTPQQTISNAFDALGRASDTLSPQQAITDAFQQVTAANQQQAMQQAGVFDQQAQGEQGKAGRAGDSFDSRFGDPNQFAPTQAPARTAETETIGLRPGQDVISSLMPATKGVGGEAAPIGLLSMANTPAGRPGGSPTGTFGSFGRPSGGQTSGRSSSDLGRPGLSITVGGRPSGGQQAAGRGSPGYYMTGGAGIARGAKGAEYGGIYGPGVATGRPGTNTFGIDSRSGAYGYYDPYTGRYYR